MKKLLAILLVLVMTVGLVPAVFADVTTYTITITPATGDTATHTYEAYQIFKGDLANGKLSNIEWGSGVDESSVDYKEIVQALGETYDESKTYTANDIAEMLSNNNVDTFAEIIAEYLSEVKSDSTENTITVSAPGYYFVKDGNDSLEGNYSAYTKYILRVLGSVTVEAKSDVPSIVKKVDDINDTTGKHTDESNNDADDTTWIDSADYDIGDNVPFQITVNNGSHVSDFTTYTLTIHDKQSEGLDAPEKFEVTLDNDISWDYGGGSTCVTVNNNTTEATAIVSIGDVEVTARVTAVWTASDTETSSDDCTFHITVTYTAKDTEDKEVAIPSALNDSKVTVNYTAKLNAEAKMGSEGNPNETWLEYSNNPYDSKNRGETPHDKVIVFTYQVDVSKVQGNTEKTPLNGAKFALWKKVAGTPSTSLTKWESYDETNYSKEITYYTEGDDSYYWQLVEIITPVEVKDDDGNVTAYTGSAKGIDDGDYKLEEVVTPPGYNTTDDIEFTVAATHEEDSADPKLLTLTGGDNVTDTVDTGVLATEVVNNAGSELPSTGGIGTTIFYCVGGLLAVGAAILLITKKRMTAED